MYETDDITLTALEADVLYGLMARNPRPSRISHHDYMLLMRRLENMVNFMDPAPAECTPTCEWCNRHPYIAHRVG